MITLKRLKEVLRYDPETGRWTWIKKTHAKSNMFPGQDAGCYDPTNHYVLICIDKKIYLGHRLAWFYMTGEWPEEIDHKNCDGWDNRWENLRLSTRQQNNANTRKRRVRKVDLPKGVNRWSEERRGNNRYYARITVDNKQIHLGSFPTKDQASDAYLKAASIYFGEYARKE